ncbi:toll/interleukin-1 receptor domain-containing protein [Actinoplanes sp. TBRC 11911]|uniref:TIR domain-containing protein n=1 Tax=Actinoplanes sp. TBRC 11911 TaxID=2729386 RepID=UPI00145D4574|nr:TIR domain-containing protein [Actinoplanes sp. TBRC 11911]NMO57745.1 toll/interleukin-1 receptor domain-containing protein [Actinoplanes sp. TBRC 11911]
MSGHELPQIFISYAHADGGDMKDLLRRRLPDLPPGWRVWTDDLIDTSDRTFSLPIQRAIDASAVSLFVVTAASSESEYCALEVERARSRRLPYAVIRPRPEVALPLTLGLPPKLIDMVEGDEAGWQKLERFLRDVGTPRESLSVIEEVREREIAAAVGATGTERERFELRDRELAASIERERERIADPAAAERRTRERIKQDLALDREPAPDPTADPIVTAAGVRMINELPGIPPVRFHDRADQLRRLTKLLEGPDTRLIALTGRDGMGKTALLDRLRRSVGYAPLSDYRAVVLLDASGYRRITTATLLFDLARVLEDPEAGTIRNQLERPVPSVDKLTIVLGALGERGVLVVVDGAEELLDDEQELKDQDLREVCFELAVREGHGVRVLFVAQCPPRALFREVGRPRAVEVEPLEGLPMPAAGDLLRTLDSKNLFGPAATDDNFMSRLCDVTGGRPRSLELFYGILLIEWFTKPDQLLDRLEQESRGADVAVVLFDRMLNDLFDLEVRVVEALAVYGRPVLAGAVARLLPDVADGASVEELLGGLERRQLVRRDGERYYLPSQDAAHVVARLRKDAPDNLRTLRQQAADYHHAAWTPEQMVRQLADLDGHLNEIEMRVAAGEYEVASRLMNDLDQRYLRRWGQSALLLPLRADVAEHLPDRRSRIDNLSMSGAARSEREQYMEAVKELRGALRLARTVPEWKVVLWRELGAVEGLRGRLTRANRLFRMAVAGAHVLGMREEAARAHLNLGLGMARLGHFPAALRHNRRGLAIAERHPVADEIVVRLHLTRGWTQGQLGRHQEALKANARASRLAVGRDLQLLAGVCALRRAELLVDSDEAQAALEPAEQAHRAGLVARNAALLCDASRTIALVHLRGGRVDEAADAARAGMLHRSSQNAVELYLLRGIVAFRQGGRRDAARSAFAEAARLHNGVGQVARRDYGEHNIRGLVLAGLALCGDRSQLEPAIAAFGRARAAAVAPGSVRRNEILLRQFGESADPLIVDRLLRTVQG